MKRAKRMLGDKAYDSAELREELDERGTKPVIPNRCNRKQPFSFSKRLYKLRWRIESAFNRLKDFRRIATRYDRLAQKLLGLCLPRRRSCMVVLTVGSLVRPKAAWKMLGCGNTRGYELLATGELKSFKDGGSRKITVESIHRYIARHLKE